MSVLTEDAKFTRFQQLGWWKRDVVQNSVVLVAGAGALGNEVLKNLALMGLGGIIVADFDHVEPHNVRRSVLFREDQIGLPKAEAAVLGVKALAPDCAVLALNGDLRLHVGPGLMSRVDAVIGCVDNIEARIIISEAAGAVGKPYIDGGLLTWEGTVSGFMAAEDAPCFACTLSSEDWKALQVRQSCAVLAARAEASAGLPTTPIVSSIIGAIAAQECLNALHGGWARDDGPQSARSRAGSLAGRQLRYSLASNRSWNVGLRRNKDCPAHPEALAAVQIPGVTSQASWREIFDACKQAAGAPPASIHLPAMISRYTRCEKCNDPAKDWKVQPPTVGLICPHCKSPRRGEIENHANKDSQWLDRSPADLGIPAYSWIYVAYDDMNVSLVEIGGDGPLEALKRRK